MRRLCLLIVGVLVLAGTAAALNPVNVAVKSSSTAVVADNTDSADITVIVTDGVNTAIAGANVTLSITQPWSLRDTRGTTGGDGKFLTKFLPTTTSGTAVITATAEVLGVTTSPVVQTFSQTIIAGTPSKSASSYNLTGSVGDITDITIRVTDKYGNPVTSRIKKNSVSFATTLTGDNAFLATAGSLWGGYTVKVKQLSIDLNDTGYADVDFMLKTHPGDNFIIVTLPSPLPATLISIQSVADLPPSDITQTVIPSGRPPTLPTDGISKFTINYQLSDKYGNPSTLQGLSITTNAREMRNVTSNSEGKVTITYGPKTGAGRYIITATSQDNSKVRASQTVQFVSGKASTMVLTASPQTMASGDSGNGATALVMAKVVDTLGNPVSGQTVYFSIQNVKTGTFVQVKDPSIQGNGQPTSKQGEKVSAVTDESGYANAIFTPGSFTTDMNNSGFSVMAEGTASIKATWGDISKNLDIKYVNYPYLSVYSSVSPTTVETNGTVDLSIVIRGDGYAMKPKPVMAYMVTDRSGSMEEGNPSRMELVKNAAISFQNKFDYSVDRLGQFSFGGDVTLDLPLTDQPAQVQNQISLLTPSGYTPMRLALHDAITALANQPNKNAVKGLVVLTDGDYNWYGDPLARGSPGVTWVCDSYTKSGSCRSGHNEPWSPDSYQEETTDTSHPYYSFTDISNLKDQNMSQYARDNNIRIYAIGYSSSLSTRGQQTLHDIATTTGGQYYYALTPDDLLNFYGQIAGALKDTAGVNTTLSLDFSSVNVNGTYTVTPGSKALQYVFMSDASTKVTRPNGTFYTVNSTADWNKGRINVSIGTVKVNETWTVDLLLRPIMDGNIRLISSSSKVFFNDNEGLAASIPAPDTFVTSIPAGSDKGVTTPKLAIKDLRKINPETDRDKAELVWVVSYDGKDPVVVEEIEIAMANTDVYFPRGSTTTPNGVPTGEKSIDVSDLPPGVYKARVTGIVSDADSSFNITQFTLVGPTQTGKIVIH